MLNEIINNAKKIEAKYSYELDSTICNLTFFKAKLDNDRAKEKTLNANIYKKIK